MGGSCRTHVLDEKCIQNFGQKVRREETSRNDMDWIHLAQERDQWWAVVNTVMNHLVL